VISKEADCAIVSVIVNCVVPEPSVQLTPGIWEDGPWLQAESGVGGSSGVITTFLKFSDGAGWAGSVGWSTIA
jgi:hypothetical protein